MSSFKTDSTDMRIITDVHKNPFIVSILATVLMRNTMSNCNSPLLNTPK